MIIGVNGKIASGKSEVLKILGERGFYCIDADKIVHDLYGEGGTGAKVVAAVFGDEFLAKDGSVDRVKLRDVVFADEAKLKLLNDVIHPLVYEEIAFLTKAHEGEDVAIEATYFDPNFLEDFVDKLIWVERPDSEILKVLVEERGFTPELAEKVLNNIEKPADVDFVVENDGDLGDLKILCANV
jgi:dephospho-CoA kinase